MNQLPEQHCHVESGGYSGIKDVCNANSPSSIIMGKAVAIMNSPTEESLFIAETLK